jgi:hypothetical protein
LLVNWLGISFAWPLLDGPVAAARYSHSSGWDPDGGWSQNRTVTLAMPLLALPSIHHLTSPRRRPVHNGEFFGRDELRRGVSSHVPCVISLFATKQSLVAVLQSWNASAPQGQAQDLRLPVSFGCLSHLLARGTKKDAGEKAVCRLGPGAATPPYPGPLNPRRWRNMYAKRR